MSTSQELLAAGDTQGALGPGSGAQPVLRVAAPAGAPH